MSMGMGPYPRDAEEEHEHSSSGLKMPGDAEADVVARDAWLKERQSGIGASEAAAAIGVSPFMSPFQLWSEKTGLAEHEDLSAVEAVEWGTRLEQPIADAFAERTGRAVALNDTRDIFRHDDHEWMLTTIDGMQEVPRRTVGLLELKTANAFAAGEWKDEPPLHYQVQLQHQLAATGLEWGTLCVLIGGQKMLWFDQNRNERFIDDLIQSEAEFWQLVQSKTPPEVDGSEQTTKALKRLYPSDDGDVIELPEEANEWDDRLQEVKKIQKELEGERRGIENHLKAVMGNATVGIVPAGGRYSWKTQNRAEYTVEAATLRILRRHKK